MKKQDQTAFTLAETPCSFAGLQDDDNLSYKRRLRRPLARLRERAGVRGRQSRLLNLGLMQDATVIGGDCRRHLLKVWRVVKQSGELRVECGVNNAPVAQNICNNRNLMRIGIYKYLSRRDIKFSTLNTPLSTLIKSSTLFTVNK